MQNSGKFENPGGIPPPGMVFPESATITGVAPPAAGTWTISADTEVNGETLLLNGSIEVQNGKKLEFVNSFVSFSSPSYGIDVEGNVTVNSTTLRGFDGLVVGQGAYGVIYNSTLEDFGQQAVKSEKGNVSVCDSIIQNGGVGLAFGNQHGIYISGNTITTQNESIRITSCSDVLIAGCVLRATKSTGSTETGSIGIRAGSTPRIRVENCTVQNHEKTIYWSNVSESSIRNSFFAHTKDSPNIDGELQFVDESNGILIENNHINNLTYDGIEIYRSRDYLIQDNVIENTGAGFHIRHAPLNNFTIYNNTLRQSSMIISDIVDLFILNNTLKSGNINVQNSTNVVIKYNIVCGGIHVGGSTNVTIADNVELCPGIRGYGVTPILGATGVSLAVLSRKIKRSKRVEIRQ